MADALQVGWRPRAGRPIVCAASSNSEVPSPPTEDLRQALFRALHSPPSDFGFNRTSWRSRDLLETLKRQGYAVNSRIVAKLVHHAGFRWRKAKITLTSNDPRFREKLGRVRRVLAGLDESEAFFSIDEFGPIAIRLRGGRKLVGPGDVHIVPQWQRSKGSVMLVAALELASNQVTHQYGTRKTTEETVRLLDLLVQRYGDLRRREQLQGPSVFSMTPGARAGAESFATGQGLTKTDSAG